MAFQATSKVEDPTHCSVWIEALENVNIRKSNPKKPEQEKRRHCVGMWMKNVFYLYSTFTAKGKNSFYRPENVRSQNQRNR